MYGVHANMTGVFVDGKCGSTKMAYIRIRYEWTFKTTWLMLTSDQKKKKHCSVWSLQKTCWLPWEKQIPSRNLTIHCKNHRIAQDNRWTPSIILGLYMFHFGKKILLYDYMIRISDLYWFIAKKIQPKNHCTNCTCFLTILGVGYILFYPRKISP